MQYTYLKLFLSLALTTPALSFAEEQENKRCEVGPITQINPSKESEAGSNWGSYYPPVYFPFGAHNLVAISAIGDSVEIEDGSVWKISSYDAHKVASWLTNDTLTITQNHRWFSKYNYRIINQTTGEAIEVNLHLGPFYNSPHSRFIADIDMNRGEVLLTDHSQWRVSLYDMETFVNWNIGDSIILGFNTGWDSSCQGLLINVTKNRHVRAEQF